MNCSLITSAYKSATFLNAYFKTIFAQTILPSEIIIIDDTGNPENFNEIINQKKKIYNYNNIFFFKNEKNLGPARSLNIALSKCNYDLIFRLDIDDRWTKNHIQKMLDLHKINPGNIIYAESVKFKNIINYIKCDKLLINENHLIHSSWLINRNLLKNFRYKGTFKIFDEDYFTLLFLLKKGFSVFIDYDYKKKTTFHNKNINSLGHSKILNQKYIVLRKKLSKQLFLHYSHKKNFLNNKYNSLFFILFEFGILNFLVFLFWTNDYIKVRYLKNYYLNKINNKLK